MHTLTFSTHEGIELVSTLSGQPGSRLVHFSRGGKDYGSFTLSQLLANGISVIAPFGEVETCPEDQLVLLDLARMNQLAEWAQVQALGRDEGVAA